jgi:hypothetical protein
MPQQPTETQNDHPAHHRVPRLGGGARRVPPQVAVPRSPAGAKGYAELAAAKKDHAKVQSDAEQAVAEAQKLIDQQVADMKAEADRVRAHYEAEARKACEASQEAADRASREAESLRRFSQLAGEEEEVRHALSAAMAEATALREQAR